MGDLIERCEAVSDDGDECCRQWAHAGPHQDRPCDGTCDTCGCAIWWDIAPAAVPQPEEPRP